ncbi:HNH endonuclease [Streptomyces sp. NPDC001604]|uniref:HNH endonuclease n=1 Tax=Streptomyces sp. NPDC001604 TaxID=3364593 RepID=UPI0036B9C6D9
MDFAELAHIIPASPVGPRAVPLSEVSAEARAHHRNLILLCANCHTTIDKAPDPYPADILYGWKQERVNEIQVAVATPVCETRAEARARIQRPLDDNALIHARYGPVGDPYQQGDPVLWLRHARPSALQRHGPPRQGLPPGSSGASSRLCARAKAFPTGRLAGPNSTPCPSEQALFPRSAHPVPIACP